MDYFGQWAEARGAITEWDPVRNKIITFNPDSKPADCYIEFISHLDTVPSGGNFDGAAGIVAGVLAAEKLIKEKILPKGIGVRVRIYRGEESGTFGVAYIGSLAAAGLLDPVHLDKSFGGQKLLDAMKSQKVDLSYITQRRPAILTEQIDTILYSDELHIEQGPILIDSGLDIGVVTSIRGAIRAVYNFTGETAHSGTTPLHLRKDAISALGPIINEFNQFLSDRLTEFPPDQNPAWDLIATITEVKGGVGPSSVGGESSMRIDLRGIDTNYMNQCVEELSQRLKAITSKLNLGFVSCELSRT
jgi:N-carbamoyl-L-amino-acid hydrolase